MDVDDRPEALGTVIVHTAHKQFFMHASPQGLSPACVVLDRSQSLLWSWDGQSASQYDGPPQVLVSRVSPASVSIRGQPDTSESLPKPGTIVCQQYGALRMFTLVVDCQATGRTNAQVRQPWPLHV